MNDIADLQQSHTFSFAIDKRYITKTKLVHQRYGRADCSVQGQRLRLFTHEFIHRTIPIHISCEDLVDVISLSKNSDAPFFPADQNTTRVLCFHLLNDCAGGSAGFNTECRFQRDVPDECTQNLSFRHSKFYQDGSIEIPNGNLIICKPGTTFVRQPRAVTS